jgi:hypothetical protein
LLDKLGSWLLARRVLPRAAKCTEDLLYIAT